MIEWEKRYNNKNLIYFAPIYHDNSRGGGEGGKFVVAQ